METRAAARSLALHAARYFRRQLNPVLNSGVHVNQQGFGTSGCSPGIESFLDSQCGSSLTRKSEVVSDEGLRRDSAILWKAVPNVSSVKTFDDFTAVSAERELKEQLALIKRSGKDLSSFVMDLAETSREASPLASLVADSSRQACDHNHGEQGLRPREEVFRWVSVLCRVGGGVGLSVLQQDNIPFECSSVKRKRKKKMNKHKQRKLRRRDRHRNS